MNSPTQRNPKKANINAALNNSASKLDEQILHIELQYFKRLHPSFNFLIIKLVVGSDHPVILCINDIDDMYVLIVEGAFPSMDI